MIKKNACYSFFFLLYVSFAAVASDTDSTFYGYKKLLTDDKRIDYLSSTINAVLSDNPKLGDSLAGVMLEVAEFSRSRKLLCQSYSNLARQYSNR
jgi:hypothetical protein